MDGQRRTSIEWMCRDDFEDNSYDLNNLISPPFHESMYHSLVNATPFEPEEETAAAAAAAGAPGLIGGTLLAAPAPAPAASTAQTLTERIRRLDLMQDESSAEEPAGQRQQQHLADLQTLGTGVSDAPSLAEAVSQALSTGEQQQQSGTASLPRVTSASYLDALLSTTISSLTGSGAAPSPDPQQPPAPEETAEQAPRQAVSCPTSPHPERRALPPRPHHFFTESVFDQERERAPAVTRGWLLRKGASLDVADAASDHTLATVDELSSIAAAAAAQLPAQPPPPPPTARRPRAKPKPSRLRELNFMAPTSM